MLFHAILWLFTCFDLKQTLRVQKICWNLFLAIFSPPTISLNLKFITCLNNVLWNHWHHSINDSFCWFSLQLFKLLMIIKHWHVVFNFFCHFFYFFGFHSILHTEKVNLNSMKQQFYNNFNAQFVSISGGNEKESLMRQREEHGRKHFD